MRRGANLPALLIRLLLIAAWTLLTAIAVSIIVRLFRGRRAPEPLAETKQDHFQVSETDVIDIPCVDVDPATITDAQDEEARAAVNA